jgi:hypothetical protein
MAEKPWMLVKWDGVMFRPISDYDWEIAETYRIGATLRARFAQDRSKPHLRLYWAIMHMVAKNNEKWTTAENVDWAVKTGLGYIESIAMLNGGVQIRPKSIALNEMDQAEFNVFFTNAMNLISEKIMPGTDPVELVKHAKALAGPHSLV